MADVLSALSLFLGMFIGIFISWDNKIQEAFDIEKPRHQADGSNQYKQVKNTIKKYLLPLTVVSVLLTLIILPEWLKIFLETFHIVIKFDFHLKNYSIVSAIFLLLGVVFAWIAGYLVTSLFKLIRKANELKPKR